MNIPEHEFADATDIHKPSILVSPYELALYLSNSTEYALGRNTGMPSMVCRLIESHLSELPTFGLEWLERNIATPSRHTDMPYGEEFDRRDWRDALDGVRAELEARGGQKAAPLSRLPWIPESRRASLPRLNPKDMT